ncbi:IclR family transcriptional regulator [Siccirubricoccus phaeus]|uniref:IclR family transcriptional regulator n=1 Tax=Siccirubricoccus phaeus TaxID=2595053 RepID=UPI0011F1276E|nr:helix-turn-helix domain-containing protein [Siccirubricoccus phaeus]
MEAPKDRRGIHSVEVAHRVLAALQASPKPLPLKQIAAQTGLSPSAANNYLVSLARTGLAVPDERAGHYRLGPGAVALGLSAIRQIDGYEILRREVTLLRDATGLSAAVSSWTADGPVSLFTEPGDRLGVYDLRTGLLGMQATAAGRLFAACLPEAVTAPLLARSGLGADEAAGFLAAARREWQAAGYVAVRREDGTGYVAIAMPVWDWQGRPRFALSVIGARTTLPTAPDSPAVLALRARAAAATGALGGAAPGEGAAG